MSTATFIVGVHKEINCKFCRQKVWYNKITSRVCEVGTDTLHVENCPRRRAHYKGFAAENAEARRQSK